MKKLLIAAISGALLVTSAGLTPALAQAPAAAPAKLNAATTPIDVIVKNPKAKEALEKAFPDLVQYYDQIGSMTLTDLISVSQGMIDEAKIKALQGEFDKL
jgi:hypothetical protein